MFEAGIEATAWARTSTLRLRLRLLPVSLFTVSQFTVTQFTVSVFTVSVITVIRLYYIIDNKMTKDEDNNVKTNHTFPTITTPLETPRSDETALLKTQTQNFRLGKSRMGNSNHWTDGYTYGSNWPTELGVVVVKDLLL